MKLENASLATLSFQEMSLPSPLYTVLEKMGISKPTPIQMQAIPTILTGANLIAVAQTGSGKTLAYALPTLTKLEKDPTTRALILVPSREVAQQVHKIFLDLCAEMPISVCLAIGGMTGSKQESQLKKMPRVIVATPGRMNDHLAGNKLLLKGCTTIVIDEADRMLDMGFAPQIRAVLATLRGPRQILMFSASFNPGVEGMAESMMTEQAQIIRSDKSEEPVGDLKQYVLFMSHSMKNDRLVEELKKIKGPSIVFTDSTESCEVVGRYVGEYGFKTDLVHGELTQGHRDRVIRDFRERRFQVLVTTDLLARGIDLNIDAVINFEMPFKAEDFLHRIGRTARAGRSGKAITFVTPTDTRTYHKIKGYTKGAQELKLDPTFKFLDRDLVFNGRKREELGESPRRIKK